MKSVIVFGPPGCGKTKNAEILKQAYGLKTVQDEWTPGTEFPKEDCLVLTSFIPLAGRSPYKIVEFKEAIKFARGLQ